MFKNATPRQVSIFIAFAVSLFIFLFFLSMSVSSWPQTTLGSAFLASFLSFVFTLVIGEFAILRFVYRRIKPIYKIIYSLKSPVKNKSIHLNPENDAIQEVEKEVYRWIVKRKNEIEQMKRMEKFRKEFLGNVSHELKTPLNNLYGLLETLIDGGINDPNVNLTYLKKALNNTERLSAIIKDLSDISAIENGQITLQKEDFSIYDLTREVISYFNEKASQKNIKLDFKKGADKDFQVNADKNRIRQVLSNLIENAINYSYKGCHVQIGFYDMEDKILVEVTDNGPGIAREHLDRLFERFYRIDPARSRENGGSGLGLAIAKHIIEAHDQIIHVRSTVGVGSTFGFTLSKSLK